MLRLSKTRFYLVPVVMRTLDILEFLRTSETPMKPRDISLATKIPGTTTYRVLRTLLHRGYVIQDIEGKFSIPVANGRPLRKRDFAVQNAASDSKVDLSGDEVVALLHGVLECIRSASDASTIRITVDDLD